MIKDIRIENNGIMTWWSWIEICDKCGKIIQNHKTKCSVPPYEHKAHFCCTCMRYFMDKGILYEEAFAVYKKG